MTAENQPAGASFHGVMDWSAIDWQKAHHTVRRLQARIVAVGMGVAQCLTSTLKDDEWTRAWHQKGKRRLQQAGGFLRAILTW